MKKKLINNIGLKIISVILAIVFWLIVMNVSDYSITVKIENIPVQQINGEVLEELDQIYDIASGDTVDIIVKGRRSVVSKLSAGDFVATADLSKMSITNTVQIFVSAKSHSINDEISISCVDNTMKLNLEDKVAIQYPIKGKAEGEPMTGYAVGEIEARPNIVTIEGPMSAVEKITEVRATVNVSSLKSSYEAVADIKLYDAYGEEIKNDKITLSQDTVHLNISVYPVKTVDINVSTRGSAASGYDVANVIYQPHTIELAGETEKLNRITSIDINDISVSGLDENLETMVNINEYLPDGVFVVGDSSEIAVSVVIKKLESKTYSLNEKDITLSGKNGKYIYEVVLSDDFTITASGLMDVMDELSIESIKPGINCLELAEGTNNNVTLILNEIEGVTYETSGTITVIIKEK